MRRLLDLPGPRVGQDRSKRTAADPFSPFESQELLAAEHNTTVRGSPGVAWPAEPAPYRRRLTSEIPTDPSGSARVARTGPTHAVARDWGTVWGSRRGPEVLIGKRPWLSRSPDATTRSAASVAASACRPRSQLASRCRPAAAGRAARAWRRALLPARCRAVITVRKARSNRPRESGQPLQVGFRCRCWAVGGGSWGASPRLASHAWSWARWACPCRSMVSASRASSGSVMRSWVRCSDRGCL